MEYKSRILNQIAQMNKFLSQTTLKVNIKSFPCHIVSLFIAFLGTLT